MPERVWTQCVRPCSRPDGLDDLPDPLPCDSTLDALAHSVLVHDHEERRRGGLRNGGKGRAHAPVSFLHKKFKSVGARSGYAIASLFLPGHPIPATLFNGFSSRPAIDCLECFQFLFRVRLLHKLGDADRRLTRQDCLFGPRLARAEGCPATPRKADDYGDHCPHK